MTVLCGVRVCCVDDGGHAFDSKEYMHECLAIDPKWLIELAPRFYRMADAQKMSKRKRKERIEPLYDRFNPPNDWKLSKRQG